MEFRIAQTADRLVVDAPLPAGNRILFLLLSLFPLIAPYELILRPRCESFLHPFFLLAAFISAGAVAVSAFLFWAAIAGLDTETVFDRTRARLTHTIRAPILPEKRTEYPLDLIATLTVEKHEWSDGGPSYSFTVGLRDGKQLRCGSTWSRKEAEALRERAAAFLGMSS
jgi:hypothetical protein